MHKGRRSCRLVLECEIICHHTRRQRAVAKPPCRMAQGKTNAMSTNGTMPQPCHLTCGTQHWQYHLNQWQRAKLTLSPFLLAQDSTNVAISPNATGHYQQCHIVGEKWREDGEMKDKLALPWQHAVHSSCGTTSSAHSVTLESVSFLEACGRVQSQNIWTAGNRGTCPRWMTSSLSSSFILWTSSVLKHHWMKRMILQLKGTVRPYISLHVHYHVCYAIFVNLRPQ